MNVEKILSAAVVFCAAFLVYGQEALLAPKTSADWEVSGAVPADKEKSVVCTGKGNIELYSKNAVGIDPAKAYAFSGMFKAESASAPFKCYFGLSPMNEKGELIRTNQVNYVKGTETELAGDCSPDDTALKIKNGETWKPNPHACIAFEIDDSGKYADLPNAKLSSPGIVKVEKKDGVYEVTMKGRCNVKYPIGTKIRMHSAGPSAIYGGAAGKAVSGEWTEIKGIIKPEAVDNMNLLVNWWPGVRKAKFFVAFYPENTDSSVAVSFKDIKMEEAR